MLSLIIGFTIGAAAVIAYYVIKRHIGSGSPKQDTFEGWQVGDTIHLEGSNGEEEYATLVAMDPITGCFVVRAKGGVVEMLLKVKWYSVGSTDDWFIVQGVSLKFKSWWVRCANLSLKQRRLRTLFEQTKRATADRMEIQKLVDSELIKLNRQDSTNDIYLTENQ